ncbi:hypothetical protein Tco_0255052 [Tanacetum coccineum]
MSNEYAVYQQNSDKGTTAKADVLPDVTNLLERSRKSCAFLIDWTAGIRRIQVKDIVKEVEDYLKTYSSAGMDISCLPRKWLSMNQTQRANSFIKNDTLAALYGKYNYKEGLIDQIYESETTRFSIQDSSSKALISNTQFQDSDSDVEEDTKSSNELLANLNAEFHDRALLSNQKRYYQRSGRVGSAKKPIDKTKETCFACSKLVSSKDEGVTKVKAFMAFAEEEPFVGKNDARSGQWVEITMRKVQGLLSMTDVPGNIVHALRGRGNKKETISSKAILFYKVAESPYETVPEITSDSKSKCGDLEPLPPLPKLTRAESIGTSAGVLDKRLSVKAPKKKAQTMSPSVPDPIPVKKADSSTGKLLLTLMEEVKGLKEQIKIPLDTSPSVSQSGSSKSAKVKQKTWFGPCKHCGVRNHLPEDCYMKPKCSTCGSTDHLTKEHSEQAVVRKTLAKLKLSHLRVPLKERHL